MGQIMLGKHYKESVGSVAELLPTVSPGLQERRLDVSRKRSSSSIASTFLVILSVIFALSALKQICDLREQNLSLIQQLIFERQKDAALKLAVRENVPEDKFLLHMFSPAEAGRVEAEGKVDQPRSTWSINLSVLWTSPTITPCDMSRLAQVLAREIYQVQEKQEQTLGQDKTEEENMKEKPEISYSPQSDKNKENGDLINELFESKEESSEESEENIKKISDPFSLIQSGESVESKEESSDESEENIEKEISELLNWIQLGESDENEEDTKKDISDLLNLLQSDYGLLNESSEEEDDTEDYYLSNPDIYEEYDLLGISSEEQDYYNYYE